MGVLISGLGGELVRWCLLDPTSLSHLGRSFCGCHLDEMGDGRRRVDTHSHPYCCGDVGELVLPWPEPGSISDDVLMGKFRRVITIVVYSV
jgi:hypothetical protein